MLLAQDNAANAYQLRGYEVGCLRINDTDYRCPVLLSAHSLHTDRLPEEPAALCAEHIDMLCTSGAEVILLGTGARQQLLPLALQAQALRHQRVIDVMDTRAAAHTFVVLSSEGRRVLAALYP